MAENAVTAWDTAQTYGEADGCPPVNAMSRAAMLVLLGVLIAGALANVNDGDLFWQRALGEHVLLQHNLPVTLGQATFSAPDARWLPHEWLFATLWALAERSSMETAFRIGCALIAFAAVAIDAIRIRQAAPAARTIVLILIVAGLMPSFAARAQVFTWPLLSLVMLALEARPIKAWSIVLITVVWANLHASAIIVPAIVVIYGLGHAITVRRVKPLLSTFGLAAVCLIACAVTPFGVASITFAASWTTNPATRIIGEWQRISVPALPYFGSAFIIIALIVAGELRGARVSWSHRLLTLVFFGAALLHVRNLPLFCLVAGPWAASALTALLPSEAPTVHQSKSSDRGLLVVGACGAIAAAFAGIWLSHNDRSDVASVVQQLVARNAETRVACEDFSWCSRFALVRKVRVFLDGRVDAYPKPVFDDYRNLLAGNSAEILSRWRIDAVLARSGGNLAGSMRVPGWRRISEGPTELYVRVPI